MRALVLWADHGSPNLGVRALAEGAEALLRSARPGIEVTCQNYGRGPSPFPVRTSRGLVRERLTGRGGLMAWLASFDVIVDTRAGDSFSDIYGLGRLTIMSLLGELASEAGPPVVLAPQTIGPFDTRRGRALARWTLRRSTIVMTRDTVSEEYASRLGRRVDVPATDVVFALPRPDVPQTRDVVVNVSGLLWHDGPHVDAARYRDIIRRLVLGLRAAGREVSLLAHVLSSTSPDDDVPAVHEVAASMAPESEVVVPSSLAEARDVVTSARLVIGSRMHACLNALSVGTPAIPLAYSRKFAPLLTDLGWDHTFDLREAGDPVSRVLELAAADDDLGAEAEATRRRAQQLLDPAIKALAKVLPTTAATDRW